MQRRQQRLTVQRLQVMQLRVMREAACARSLQAAFETTRAHQLDAWTLGSRVMKLHAIGLAVSAEMLLHALQAAEQQQQHLQQQQQQQAAEAAASASSSAASAAAANRSQLPHTITATAAPPS